MSYLDVPRLHFAGLFQADTSTVNNAPWNYDTTSFKEKNLEPVHGQGGWNPMGTGAFRLKRCRVTSVVYRDGTRGSSSADDPVVGCAVRDNDLRVAAKMVDLHPLEQSIPQVWGLRLILGRAEQAFVAAKLVPPASGDLWYRAQGGDGDPWLAAAFQSVLKNVRWGDAGGSRFLGELREASPDELSIKFNLDGFDNDRKSPGFTYGRIVGTLGPSAPSEPRYFVLGRHLKRKPPLQDDFHGSPPSSPMYSAPARVDERRRKVLVDLGNSLATTEPGGALLPAFADIGLAVCPEGAPALPLGRLDCSAPDAYLKIAGVFEAPAGRTLTDEELAVLANAPLAVVRIRDDGDVAQLLIEDANGIDVRPDLRVFRLDPGDAARAEFHATRFGVPVRGLRLDFDLSISPYSDSQLGTQGLKCTYSAVTDARGRTPVRLEASDPGQANEAVDGQVYYVQWKDDPDALVVNKLSIRVFEEFAAPEAPAWGDIRDVMQQYANLYPVMKRIVDLGDEENVLRHRDTLILALSLPVDDPNHMPVTRDLSRNKRAAILKWLTSAGGTRVEEAARREAT